MRHVIIRDDDTNASTPTECLERLYRPALDRGWPINLATIPEVSLDARNQDGKPEDFLRFKNGSEGSELPIGSNQKLTAYLRGNNGFEIIQHGLHHHYFEFERIAEERTQEALDRGSRLLMDAGFQRPRTFVAPHDKFSPASLERVARQFQVISSGWYELQRLPRAWWPGYAWKKLSRASHWRAGGALLLTHPGCLLSCFRDHAASRMEISRHIQTHRLTVLVTHWWEYYRSGTPDEEFIGFLHETFEMLARDRDIRVIRFSDLVTENIPVT